MVVSCIVNTVASLLLLMQSLEIMLDKIEIELLVFGLHQDN